MLELIALPKSLRRGCLGSPRRHRKAPVFRELLGYKYWCGGCLMSARGRILICYACHHHAGQCWQQLVSLPSTTPFLKMMKTSLVLGPCCCSVLFLTSDSAKSVTVFDALQQYYDVSCSSHCLGCTCCTGCSGRDSFPALK